MPAPPGTIEVQAFGEQDQLTTDRVRQLIEQDPDT
jgi:hypothetical protein